jgi:uncharacterized protein (DUF169 family)
MGRDWKQLSAELNALLGLQFPPIAITFSHEAQQGIPFFSAPMPASTADGRTGRVPAGCVFWVEAAKASFTTVPEDHGNCSVGGMTHGLKTLWEIAANSDVAALVESGWATLDIMATLPVIKERFEFISYGPLQDATADPDVVLLRINAKQAMVLSDAVPGLRFEGKPQCHIVPLAKESDEVAISVGCMLSRVRTGMANTEMTCAIPGGRLAEVVRQLTTAAPADRAVAGYASQDAQRFGR